MSSIVETKYGKIEGQLEGNIHTFKGVPFAKPPVGKLRFKAPEPPEKWSGVREAKEWGGSAPQPKLAMHYFGEIKEDCLYLNIFTPGLDGKKRPVMYWIHGGAFFLGTGSGPLYDGVKLASRGDVVIVTINYRLGALGFSHFGDLLDSDFPVDSNVGMLDQVAGLEWVRDNIEAFGGDPNNVTIFGESAGGMSVGSLLGISKARGLFHKAIPQSGAASHCGVKEDAVKITERLLQELGVDKSSPEKLWEIPADKFVEAQEVCADMSIRVGTQKLPSTGMVFIPVVDGDVITEQPLEAVGSGKCSDVAIMAGHTLEELKLFTAIGSFIPKNTEVPPLFKQFMTLKDMNEEEIIKFGETFFSDLAGKAADFYKTSEGRSGDMAPLDIFTMIATDYMFRIPAIRLLEASRKHQPKSYMYRLDWKSILPGFGACHAIDIPFVFGWTDDNIGKMFTGGGPAALKLSENMQDAWLNFAKNGNPSHPGLPEWPAYDAEKRATMVFNKECTVQEAPFDEDRKFWDGIL